MKTEKEPFTIKLEFHCRNPNYFPNYNIKVDSNDPIEIMRTLGSIMDKIGSQLIKDTTKKSKQG